MERTEPTFVPEWLKSSGGLNTTSHQLTSSLKSDEQGASKPLRNKSLDKDLGRVSVSDKTTSSYFRRTSISNGSVNLRSYSSFNRNHRDRDLDKDIFEFRNKEKSENRHGNHSDSLGNILPSRFEKDGLRRLRSGVTIKQGESWPRKGASELTLVNKSSHVNGGSLLSGNVKTSFERNFPSLGADEKQVDSDIGRVSPGLSSAIQSLPVGNSTMIGGEGWTSALAEVPVIVSNNGNGSSVQPAQQNSISATTSLTGGRNMAETLTRGPPRTQTAPQLTVGTQRLEELAVKQSRQLIPMTPPMPKALGCDKPKLKIGQSQLITNPCTPRSANVKPDFSKTSNVGKLLVLKSTRERNGILPTAKESLSPTSGSNLQNSPPLEVASAPLSKSGVVVLDKRPSSQAQSRSNFFNLMRKKSMASSNSSSVAPDTREPMVPDTGGSGPAVVQQSSDTKVDVTCNRDAVHVQSGPDVIPYSEEEEARLLRAMGWEETAEEEVLTEEEISSFYQHLLKVKPTSKGAQPKLLMPTSFNSKLDS